MKKIYGYARLSRDEDRKNYGSIETQINLINEYSQKTFGRKTDKHLSLSFIEMILIVPFGSSVLEFNGFLYSLLNDK